MPDCCRIRAPEVERRAPRFEAPEGAAHGAGLREADVAELGTAHTGSQRPGAWLVLMVQFIGFIFMGEWALDETEW